MVSFSLCSVQKSITLLLNDYAHLLIRFPQVLLEILSSFLSFCALVELYLHGTPVISPELNRKGPSWKKGAKSLVSRGMTQFGHFSAQWTGGKGCPSKEQSLYPPRMTDLRTLLPHFKSASFMLLFCSNTSLEMRDVFLPVQCISRQFLPIQTRMSCWLTSAACVEHHKDFRLPNHTYTCVNLHDIFFENSLMNKFI